MEIAKAIESLKAAESYYDQGLYNSSVSRASYAVYQAARVALEVRVFAIASRYAFRTSFIRVCQPGRWAPELFYQREERFVLCPTAASNPDGR